MTPYLNPFISQHVDILWDSLVGEFGRTVQYWPGADSSAAVSLVLIWKEGVEDEAVSPGRYSHALVRNADLPTPPAKGDVVERDDGLMFDVVRINAYAYYYATIVLEER